MYTMPAPAATMASQVRSASRWPSTARATSAVNSGPTDMMMSTLATVVKVSASMKAVNITLQQTPEIQNALERASTPQWRSSIPCPGSSAICPAARSAARHQGRITSSDSVVKALRQNVTSKRAADSSWRETTPAIDHIRVTTIIMNTAWVCVRRLRARRAWSVRKKGRVPGDNGLCGAISLRGWRACGRAPSGGACAGGCSWA